jgi:hypothetical protein
MVKRTRSKEQGQKDKDKHIITETCSAHKYWYLRFYIFSYYA